MGTPDYQPTWIAVAEVKQKNLVPCSATQLCKISHTCLRCRADETRFEYDKWDYTDDRIAAHVLLHKEQTEWKTLRTTGICEYLMDLDDNLMKRPRLQKAVAHFGALRLSSEKFKEVVEEGKLKDFDVWDAEIDGSYHYLATFDPMNEVYAAWLWNVTKGLRLPSLNMDRLGDIVEAGLGLLYLATMYPSNFKGIILNPNWMWRRIETSMRSQKTWTCPIKLAKKRKGPGLLITTPEELPDLQRIKAELRYNPMVLDPMQIELTPPEREMTTSSSDLVVEQLSGTCQFCESGSPTPQCTCKMGALLRMIWKSSVEPTSSCSWEGIRKLLDDAENSVKKRQSETQGIM